MRHWWSDLDTARNEEEDKREKNPMHLNETMHICLLALSSRYPEHIVDINEDILGRQSLGSEGWKAFDIIELLRRTQPAILRAKARLVIDQQECSMYLVNQSEDTPALYIHSQVSST